MSHTSKDILEAAALFRLITPENRELVSGVMLGMHMTRDQKTVLETLYPIRKKWVFRQK